MVIKAITKVTLAGNAVVCTVYSVLVALSTFHGKSISFYMSICNEDTKDGEMYR
jgi:hypothetical protein